MKYHFCILTLIAVWMLGCSQDPTPSYQISVSRTPEEGGIVVQVPSEQEQLIGTDISLTAEAEEGYRFTGWSGDTNVVENPLSFPLLRDMDIIAQFEKRAYPLSVLVVGEGRVEQSVLTLKSTSYEFESRVELSAIPDTGWVFTRWTGDVISMDSVIVVDMEESREVTAIFQRKSYALTINEIGEGRVLSEAISPKSSNYSFGTTVQLTAEAARNWQFIRWEGDTTSTDATILLNMDRAWDVTAVFEPSSYELSLSIVGEGEVLEEILPNKSNEYPFLTRVQLTAIPAEGWRFKHWRGDIGWITPVTTILIDEPKNVVAVFEKQNFELSITIEGEGTINQITTVPKASRLPYETLIELEAIPKEGWTFKGWAGDTVSTSRFISFTLLRDTELTVRFDELFYLAENGYTIICEDASVGMEGEVHGRRYIAVNNNTVRTEDPSRACTSNVTSMEALFSYNEAFNDELRHWDFSNVTNMRSMFEGASSFNQDIQHWDVSNVIDMTAMFLNASSFNQSLNTWNVSNVQSMERMFGGATSFNGAVDEWNVTKVEDMGGMFRGAATFNQPIGNWEVSNVTDMRQLFSFASSFNQDISNWDVSSVTNMRSMFNGAQMFDQDLSNWDVGKVTDMEDMFKNAANFNQPLDSWTVSSVLNMGSMFSGASSFNQPLNSWDVSNVNRMAFMFENATSFNQPIDGWDISNVEFFTAFLLNASSFSQDLSNWCVPEISFAPIRFAEGSAMNTSQLPIWGTCRDNN